MCLTLIAGQKKYFGQKTTKVSIENLELHDIKKLVAFSKGLKYSEFAESFYIQYASKLSSLVTDTTKIRIGYKCLDSYKSSFFIKKVKLNTWMTADRNLEEDRLGNLYVTGFHILWNRESARKFMKHNGITGAIYKVEYHDVHGWGFDGDGTEVVLASKMRVIGKVK